MLTDDTTIESFPTVFKSYKMLPKSIPEQLIMALSASIRHKKQWYKKIKDETILNKWIEEAKSQNIREELIKYIFDELTYLSSLYDDTLCISPVDGVFQSDNAIPDDLKAKLKWEVYPLENVPKDKKDWHPGSNNQVLDIVHPSLYCYVKGVSKEIKEEDDVKWGKFVGGGEVTEEYIHKQMNMHLDDDDTEREEYPDTYDENLLKNLINNVSNRFQWLPAEFNVDIDGKVKILSYINNLYPKKNKELYNSIERIFEKFIPLFEKTLSHAQANRVSRRRLNSDDLYLKRRSEDEDDDDLYWEYDLDYIVKDFKPIEEPKTINLKNITLQVITKIGSIILTPENPKYNGGVWHVEGMANENIVATGIYYFDVENISESKLNFRVNIFQPYNFYDMEQDDPRPAAKYGIDREVHLNNTLGYVKAEEGRCICFPNIFQHQVSEFELINKQNPGHRKILVFFLVDPTVRIKSTKTVTPQQADWMWNEVIISNKERGELKSKFNRLSKNVLSVIWEFYGGNITLNDAKKYRLNLMNERKYFYDEHSNKFYEREYTFCEH